MEKNKNIVYHQGRSAAERNWDEKFNTLFVGLIFFLIILILVSHYFFPAFFSSADA